jgi:cob(I)alamin adenosyltransferase
MDENGEWWSVGELAAASGVSVRTLHHYDWLGLLAPAGRSASGYRRYDRDGMERLYRILALRGLGFPLAEIVPLLDGDAGSLREATRARLEQAEADLARTNELRERLRHVLDAGEPSADDLMTTMEAISMGVKLDRIVTRGGDTGETARADGTRVPKDHPVMEAGGDLDELAAALGLALGLALSLGGPDADAELLRRVQNDLFDLGGALSIPIGRPRSPDDEGPLTWLDEACERLNSDLPPLDSFLLPGGGSPYVAQLHVCRAVSRRAERRAVASGEAESVTLAYLNRLSDLLFILARSVDDGTEVTWEPPARSSS